MRLLSFAVIGCGSRGRTYMRIARELGHRITAVADPDPRALAEMREIAGDDTDVRSFSTGEELLAAGKLADVALISTQDAQHYAQAKAALSTGYDLLLEKPAACSAEEVRDLLEHADALGRRIILCFVLRYTPFYQAVKRTIDSGLLGNIVTINATEGVEPWHHAHSFVRGHWSRREESTPMIVAKCSHDTDLLSWFAGSRCVSVSSHAANIHYRPEAAPPGATTRCTDGCPHLGTCPFDTHRYLTDQKRWLAMVYPGAGKAGDEEILEWLKTSRWGRCAYHCDQDTPDHQVVAALFANGVTATLTMTAFDAGRRIRIHGTKGVLHGALGADGRDPWLEFRPHGGGHPQPVPIPSGEHGGYQGHGGGDHGLISALPELLDAPARGAAEYLDGHLIAFAADIAARGEGTVTMP